MLVQYAVATMLSAWFGTWAQDQFNIGSTINGLIFAGYPLGLGLASLASPLVIVRMGPVKSTAVGLALNSVFCLGFGFVPDMVNLFELQESAAQWGFFATYTMSGLCGGVASTALTIIVSTTFPDRVGSIMALVGAASGAGCMVGPLIGSALFSTFPPTDLWSCRMPSTVFSVVNALTLPLLLFIPESAPPKQEQKASCGEAFTPQVILSLFAIGMNGTIVATLDPTLAKDKMQIDPFNYSETTVGWLFMLSSFTYMLVAIPVGKMVDRVPKVLPGRGWLGYKGIQGLGLYILGFTFMFLGPADIFGTKFCDFIVDKGGVVVVILALMIKGVGSAANNASFPDIIYNTDKDNEMLQATLSGLWNAAFALGWAIGPLVGGGLTPYDGASWGSFSSIVMLSSFVAGTIVLVGAAMAPVVEETSVEGYAPLDGEANPAI